jgi:Big-like domain-containing protein
VISGPSGPSDANGRVTFTVTNAAPEVVTYSASDVLTGVTITRTAQVTFKHTLDADRSTVTTNAGMVPADGTSGATITVTLLDGDGAPAVGHNVILAQTGTSVISEPSGPSNADGQVTFTVTNAAPEVVTYSATDVPTGITITQTAQVAFKARTVLDVRIAASADDAEESATGSMSIGSTDLELVFDLGTDQTVGMRFAGVAIPRGAAITNAYVQFQTDETGAAPTNLTIVGQATDNATPFTYLVAKIAPRPRTAAAVAWAPPGWSIPDETGPAQRTPDLAAVLQEIVNRPGWASGNALALIITGTGKRVAKAFDGAAAGAPLLHVEFVN